MPLKPEFNGSLRIKREQSSEIYLIDRGAKRLLPQPPDVTRSNLFVSGKTPVIDGDLDSIDDGPLLTDGAVLARALATTPAYLLDNGAKRWIQSPHLVDNVYQFDWGRILQLPQFVIALIPDGQPIDS